ncbi:GMP synthase [Legionella longbeachae]|uniref:Putative glutamine amidotransferase, class I n=1 Tax=Legionella longbeachae serogroup 1 (strain NSW150) TaxID=661367 RepID=D3HRE2_LEGLN|nr:GMP synthase [Legionella longbeachae]VEE01975.1 glutamine amidotransferase, class I [Legionella oakridgensis]HBD7396773.1 GMP synthase [Legionella pneumophila]ARB91715.1 GMP synthase [Legionella longbeachae]ARM35141.1 GMP synthase [Legionella longbeachae]EEZ95418.1 class I glutamine amidotransferase domain protein [Legionella longbeachae D-4968]
MNIGILQCDQVDPELIAAHGNYPDMYKKLLHEAAPDLNFAVYDVRNNGLPKSIDAADAYLITGSRHGVNDDFPWIYSLEAFTRSLHDARKKVIGICFGHQLVVKALGGKVIKSPNGWGIGMSVNKITQHKPWMFPTLEQLNLIMSHQDQVVAIPSETEVLATSDFCPFYMLQINDNFVTVQGHPEFSKNYFQSLIEMRKQKFDKKLYEQGVKSLQLKCDDRVFAGWVVNFLSGTHKGAS